MLPVEALRIYIVFRADLPEMTRAKGEVQAAHAAASLIFTGMEKHPSRITEYMGTIERGCVKSGQAKIVMEVPNALQLVLIWQKAAQRGINVVAIEDQAHTVFTEPTFTCIAFGPCTKTEGNAITRGARMRT